MNKLFSALISILFAFVTQPAFAELPGETVQSVPNNIIFLNNKRTDKCQAAIYKDPLPSANYPIILLYDSNVKEQLSLFLPTYIPLCQRR